MKVRLTNIKRALNFGKELSRQHAETDKSYPQQTEFIISGRVSNFRTYRLFNFVDITDGSSSQHLQLVIGKEPDFTESVLSRFHSAYYTGVPDVVSQVNSLASGSLEVVSEVVVDAYESASSVVSSIFTPPPAIETILSQASEQLNQAVESASVAVYGTPKGRVEEASESLASAYSSIQSKASEAIYGTQQAQDQFVAVAASAQAAISEAIFEELRGPPPEE